MAGPDGVKKICSDVTKQYLENAYTDGPKAKTSYQFFKLREIDTDLKDGISDEEFAAAGFEFDEDGNVVKDKLPTGWCIEQTSDDGVITERQKYNHQSNINKKNVQRQYEQADRRNTALGQIVEKEEKYRTDSKNLAAKLTEHGINDRDKEKDNQPLTLTERETELNAKVDKLNQALQDVEIDIKAHDIHNSNQEKSRTARKNAQKALTDAKKEEATAKKIEAEKTKKLLSKSQLNTETPVQQASETSVNSAQETVEVPSENEEPMSPEKTGALSERDRFILKQSMVRTPLSLARAASLVWGMLLAGGQIGKISEEVNTMSKLDLRLDRKGGLEDEEKIQLQDLKKKYEGIRPVYIESVIEDLNSREGETFKIIENIALEEREWAIKGIKIAGETYDKDVVNTKFKKQEDVANSLTDEAILAAANEQ